MALPLLGVVAAFGIAPNTTTEDISRRSIIEEIRPLSLHPSEAEQDIVLHREERMLRGDTLASVLTRLGVDDAAATEKIREEVARLDLRQLRAGRTVKAAIALDGTLLSMRYLASEGHDLVARRLSDGSLEVRLNPVAFETKVGMGSGRIRSSLFQATDDAGIDDEVAVQLAEIFSGELDFHRDLQPGDRFSVVFESLYAHGEYIRSGRVLAAEFRNGRNVYRAFLSTDQNGQVNYYSEDGKSLKKSFLRSPLEFSRITSGFSNARFHPVLETWRAHRGIDYGAPIGTRVRATGDGRVRIAGQMRGYGNVVVLQHPNGYETLYGHLSGFGTGISAGTKVQQGDVIGYVGMTGLATGPHLHYELRINGVHQNPLTIIAAPTQGIPAARKSAYQNAILPLSNRLDLLTDVEIAMQD